MKEIWKDIAETNKEYQVSNLGRIKSFKRSKEGIIKCMKNSSGWYLTCSLHVSGGRIIRKRPHVLVAEAFIGERPSKKHHVHHKDGNKQNNALKNLEYVHVKDHALITIKQNPSMLDGMRKWNTIDRPTPILQFTMEGLFVAEYKNGKDASVATGVCQRNILQVANKTEYKPGLTRSQAGGFKWEFKK